MKIGVNNFVKRQTPESPFTHFDGTFDEAAQLAEDNFAEAKTAYRDGVVNVPVPATGFYSPVVQLKEGDKLVGEFSARVPGETPRIHIRRAYGEKTPAVAVELDCYRKDVLAEDGDNSTDEDWELVNMRAKAFEGNEPMHPDTLMHNHFKSDGGTATKMSPEEFEAALRESFEFWRDKALIG